MTNFFHNNGLIHQTTCPNTPEQNGVAERKNRIILEITRALIIESRVPPSFWPEAVATAVYLINRLPTKALQLKTPLQVLSKTAQIPLPLTLKPRIFGCSVFVHIPKHERTKLDPCAVKCVFLGYGINKKGYRCYDPKTRRMFTTMNCDFLETEFFYPNHLSGQGENYRLDPLSWLPISSSSAEVVPTESVNRPAETISETLVVPDSLSVPDDNSPSPVSEVRNDEELDNESISTRQVNPEPPTERYVLPPRSTRGIPPRRYSPKRIGRNSRYPVENVADNNLTNLATAFQVALYKENLPRTAEEALKSEKWAEAMRKEMDALARNSTWEVCDLPKGKKPVGCKWVFTIKRKPDGTVERYKARLVAKGYTQVYGIDYSETFSPVAKMSTVRVLMSIAADRDWPLHQFDVTNAFLHGELRQDVYMEAPPGFEFGAGKSCKLKKTLYGLKQSSRAWFGRFTNAMKSYGFQQSNSDHTLFLKKRGDLITCLIIYVDDMIITGNDTEEMENLRKQLFLDFEMKDLGPLKYFLGIEVLRSNKGIFICQKKYTLDLLTEAGMLECKPVDTPIAVNHKLQIIDGAEEADREQYQRLVGRLNYLSHTRPDIAYAVGVVSQFMHKPHTDHMEAALRIVRYLKGTYGYGLFFGKNGHSRIHGYTDADWAFVGDNLVTWRSKKQSVVALSSAEAEFRGIKSGIMEILWLKKLLTELGFPPNQAVKLYCDNKAAISISENPV